MKVKVGCVVKVENHQYMFNHENVSTVIEVDGDFIDVCIHNAYGPNESFIAIMLASCVVEILNFE